LKPLIAIVLLALAGCAHDRYQWNLSHAAFASSARRLPESERQEIVRLVSHATTEKLLRVGRSYPERGSNIMNAVTGYRDHRDALAVFGKNVRHEAEAHHWRYEMVSAKDEGLLLYLRKTHFVEPSDAVTEWNAGNLDALVASKQKAAALMSQLKGVARAQSQLNKREEHQEGRGYVLITR
jgi:hypothetical protein